jgi:integrase
METQSSTMGGYEMKGHVRLRGANNSWAIVLDARGEDGRRRRKWHSFRGSKREAQVRCAELIAESQSGGAVDKTKITVSEFLDRIQRDWLPLHATPASAARYCYAFVHVRRLLGGVPLQKLSSVDVGGMYAALVREGQSARHVKLIATALGCALKVAHQEWRLIATVPRAKVPKLEPYKIEILQPDQAVRLLEALKTKEHPLALFASVALASGARRNELLALTWDDLNFDASTMGITKALEGNTGRVKGPKTKAGERTIALPAETVAELKSHKKAAQERYMAMGRGRVLGTDRVFDGLMPDPTTKLWERAVRSLGKAVGVPAVSLHSLRHTHASLLISRGVDILTVSKRLGHAKVAITLDTYGHLIAGSDQRAAAALAEALKIR